MVSNLFYTCKTICHSRFTRKNLQVKDELHKVFTRNQPLTNYSMVLSWDTSLCGYQWCFEFCRLQDIDGFSWKCWSVMGDLSSKPSRGTEMLDDQIFPPLGRNYHPWFFALDRYLCEQHLLFLKTSKHPSVCSKTNRFSKFHDRSCWTEFGRFPFKNKYSQKF